MEEYEEGTKVEKDFMGNVIHTKSPNGYEQWWEYTPLGTLKRYHNNMGIDHTFTGKSIQQVVEEKIKEIAI